MLIQCSNTLEYTLKMVVHVLKCLLRMVCSLYIHDIIVILFHRSYGEHKAGSTADHR